VSFERPILLLALLAVPLAAALWWLADRRRARYAVRYTNLDVLASVVPGRAWRRYVPPVLALLALAALLGALARPHVERTVVSDRSLVILVVDTSRSMQAEDVEPTRLGAAQAALHAFLDEAPDRLRVALIVFAGDVQVATPPTRDHELVLEAVDGIEDFLVYGGTAIGDALEAAVRLGQQSVPQPEPGQQISHRGGEVERTLLAAAREEEKHGPVSILFLSDGSQTRGFLEPLDGAALAREARFPVYTIALGTPEGVVTRGGFGGGFGPPPSGGFGPGGGGGGPGDTIPVPPDPETLRAIAQMTGGKFSEARSADALEEAYVRLGSFLGREPGESEATFLFVAAAAALLVAAGVLSAFWSARLP
jgi:Ca-activated chloride channel family protein